MDPSAQMTTGFLNDPVATTPNIPTGNVTFERFQPNKLGVALICIVAFAIIYEFMDDAEFAGIDENEKSKGFLERFVTKLYFSAMTQVTIGFGDIVPKSNRAKIVVILQAITTVMIAFFI